MLWSLDINENMGESLRTAFKVHKSVNNIWSDVKDSVVSTYENLYDILWNYEGADTFKVGFYQSSQFGVDSNKNLKAMIGSFAGNDIRDGTKIIVDKTNLVKFQRSVLSIVKILAKYPYSFIVVKKGNNNILYASLTEILDHDFIKTNFGGKPIGGDLITDALIYNQWKSNWNRDKDTREVLWTLMNLYPIYLFSNPAKFDDLIISLFKSLTSDSSGRFSRFGRINKLDSLVK